MIRPILILAVVAMLAPQMAQAGGWRTIETTEVTTKAGAFRFLTEQNVQKDASPRMEIVEPGGRRRWITAAIGIATLKTALNIGLAGTNSVRSNYVFMPPTLRDQAGGPLVALFGWLGEPNPYSLILLRLTPAGHAEVIFRPVALGLSEFLPATKDHGLMVAGHPAASETDDQCHFTYDPSEVYTLSPTNGRFHYSLKASKIYNRRNYIWLGRKPISDFVVNMCKKPPIYEPSSGAPSLDPH